MNKVVQQSAPKRHTSAFAILCTGVLITACSKTPPPEDPPKETTASAAASEMPTGLVKNPVNHGHVADVTKWMDQASTKTAAQMAQEEKLLKEAKEKEKQALDAKRAQETKTPATKPSPVARETLAAASNPAPAPAPVVAKPAEAPPAVVAAAPAPAPVAAKTAEPERITLKLLNSVQPKYPASAARAGVTEGVVSAKIHIEPDGKVSQVEILKARPPRHFDKEVIATVMQWKYAPISRPQTTVTEFNFKMD